MSFPGVYPPPHPCESSAADIGVELRAAEGAFAAAPPDLTTFYAAAARAQRALGCAAEPLPKEQVADLYEVQAILSYVQKDPDAARAFLQGARQLGGGLPADILSNTPKLADQDRLAASATPGAPVAVQAPAGVTLLVDGTPGLTRPAGRPYLLQVVWDDGKVHWTGLMPADQTPDLARLAPPPPPPPLVVCPVCEATPCPTPEVVRAEPPPAWLTASALGTTVAAAGLYGLGVGTMHRFYDPETPAAELEGLQRRSEALTWASAGMGALALGLDVTWGIALSRKF